MEFEPKLPQREFEVGFEHKSKITDCGSLKLDENEQVSFLTGNGGEWDVVRKKWGFYATPSINGRLSDFDIRTALVKNRIGRFFLLLVEKGHQTEFEEYMRLEKMNIVAWLDEPEHIRLIDNSIKA